MQIIGTNDFEVADAVPALALDEVHLWLVEVPDGVGARELSAFAHAELGGLLRAYSGIDAPAELARGEHGKPYTIDPGYPHFNLSHGGRRVALAFARQHAIGIDVEARARRHSPLDLAERFFTASEARALATLDADDQATAFVNTWTCKEAVLKSIGRGISFGLDRLRFDLVGTEPRALAEIDEEAGSLADWHVLRFDPGAAHAGAVAWHGPPLRVRALRGQAACESEGLGARG